MSENILRYKMSLKVLSPINIGSGDKLYKYMYLHNAFRRKVLVLDEVKLAKYLAERNMLESFETYILQKEKGASIYKHLREELGWNAEKIFAEAEHFKKYELSTFGLEVAQNNANRYNNNGRNNASKKTSFISNEINTFIKNVYIQPYIPGSSIKGAIRTAIMNTAIENAGYEDFTACLRNSRDNKEVKQLAKDRDRELNSRLLELKTGDLEEKLMSGLSVSDSAPLKQTDLAIYRRVDYNIGKKTQNPMPIFFEALMPNCETEFEISLDLSKLNRIRGIKISDINDLMSVLDQSMQSYLNALPVNSDAQRFVPKTQQGASALTLGSGAGFHSKTLITSIVKGRENLVKTTARVLHNDRASSGVYKHLNDRAASPRVLKLASTASGMMMIGMAQIGVKEKC